MTCLTLPVHCLWFLWFQILILQGLKQEVTCLCPSPDGLHLAVGYEDGSIRIFSLLSGEGNVTFNGHKAAITSLKYDQLGGRLASGSKVRPWIRCPDFNLVKEYKAYAEGSCSQKLLGETVFGVQNSIGVRNGGRRMYMNWEVHFVACHILC